MSYYLFLEESGHDFVNVDYEVRGGVALQVRKLGPFISALKGLEESAFGDKLYHFDTEIKGHRLLGKDRYVWADQGEQLSGASRRKHALSFLMKGKQKRAPNRIEFTAYGQACLKLARGIFQLIKTFDGKIFASVIPKKSKKPEGFKFVEHLRKDQILLLERYYHFLEAEKEPGLIVLDDMGAMNRGRFIKRLDAYFSNTRGGRFRSHRILSAPLFASRDMRYPLGASDVVAYCINHGFRLPRIGMNADTRPEIAREFGPWISNLQYYGEHHRGGDIYKTKGIVFVNVPYGERSYGNPDTT